MEPSKPTRAAPTLAKNVIPSSTSTDKVLYSGEPAILYPVGIKTSSGKYVTVETFGDQLNTNGTALRNKQVFILETDGNGHFAFKAHTGKYLSANHNDVKATSTEKRDHEWFTLHYTDGVARVYNHEGKVLVADPNLPNLQLLSSTNSPFEEFDIPINFHPQICLSIQKRYLAVVGNEVISNRDTQFGRDTLLTREEGEKRGFYALKSFNEKFLSVDPNGIIVATRKDSKDPSAQFSFEFHGNNLAIKSLANGKYLTVHASGLKTERANVTLKEIFKMVDSDAQITLKANNSKYLTFQGITVSTRSVDNPTTDDIFILETVQDKWAFRTIQENYLSVQDGVLQLSSSKKRTDDELFYLEYYEGKTAIKAFKEGKYLSAKNLGGVEAKLTTVAPQALFDVLFLNRPQLVLQTCQQSFVGTTDGKSIRTNKSKADVFDIEYKNGKYALKLQNKYMREGGDSKMILDMDPQFFYFEFRNGQLAIKTEKGKYLRSENQGWLLAVADKVEPTELFEF